MVVLAIPRTRRTDRYNLTRLQALRHGITEMFFSIDMNANITKEQSALVFVSSRGQLMVVMPPHSGNSVVPVTERVSKPET